MPHPLELYTFVLDNSGNFVRLPWGHVPAGVDPGELRSAEKQDWSSGLRVSPLRLWNAFVPPHQHQRWPPGVTAGRSQAGKRVTEATTNTLAVHVWRGGVAHLDSLAQQTFPGAISCLSAVDRASGIGVSTKFMPCAQRWPVCPEQLNMRTDTRSGAHQARKSMLLSLYGNCSIRGRPTPASSGNVNELAWPFKSIFFLNSKIYSRSSLRNPL